MKTSTILILAGAAGLAAWAYQSGSSTGRYSGVNAFRAGIANGLAAVGATSAANAVSPACCTGCQGGTGVVGGQQILIPRGGVPNAMTAGISTIMAINPGAASGTTNAQPVIGGILPVGCGGCN